jgi:Asp-tRNA(Asn)/Glu-tRNA(Gln) amidotransferase A subunit family amidase
MRYRIEITGLVLGLIVALVLAQPSADAKTVQLVDAAIDDLQQAMEAGSVTSARLVELFLNRIEAYDDRGPALNAIISLNPSAMQTAMSLDEERQNQGPRGPLHGIPILIKDNMDTFDLPTTAGSLSLQNSIPPDDAFIVSRLRDAGAIILGKTNLDEFAGGSMGVSSLGGQTRNPYALDRIPGGSSGGSAAAAAASFAAVALGTDTAGSIRNPSSLQSLVGLKPTLGLSSRDGIIPSFLWRDVAGPMGRSVSDVANVLDVIAGFDAKDPATNLVADVALPRYRDALESDSLQGARLGVVSGFQTQGNRDMRAVFTSALAALESAGAEIVQISRVANLPDWRTGETWYNSFEYDMNRYLESLGPEAPYHTVQEIVASGDFHANLVDPDYGMLSHLKGDVAPESDSRFQAVMNRREDTEKLLLDTMEAARLDAIVYLTAPANPPLIERPNGNWDTSIFGAMDTPAFVGWPALSVPAGFFPATRDGPSIPLGIEFLGRPFSEAQLLSFGYAFEQATHHRQTPASTPPLPGELIVIPEPATLCLAILGFLGILACTWRQWRVEE